MNYEIRITKCKVKKFGVRSWKKLGARILGQEECQSLLGMFREIGICR